MRHYELLIVFKPTYEGETLEAEVKKVSDLLLQNGIESFAVENMMVRNLGYKIKHYKRGIYNIFYFEATPDKIEDLMRVIRINESLLRYSLVKCRNNIDLKRWKSIFDSLTKPKENQEEQTKTKITQELNEDKGSDDTPTKNL